MNLENKKSLWKIVALLLLAGQSHCTLIDMATGNKDEDKSSNSVIVGLVTLASSSQTNFTSSGIINGIVFVMPECGKGYYTGETYADFTRQYIMGSGGLSWRVGLPGCNPKSTSSGDRFTYNSNRQFTSNTFLGYSGYASSYNTKLTVSYNSLNYITQITISCGITSAGNIANNYSYDILGRLSKITSAWPTGCYASGSPSSSFVSDYIYTDNELYPSTNVSSYNSDSGICKVITNFSIAKNSQGWITKLVTSSSSSGTASNTRYGCIIGQSSQQTDSYTYDGSGNISTWNSTLNPTSPYIFKYDSSGRVSTAPAINMGCFGVINYIYNSSGQLTLSELVCSGITHSMTTFLY
ncbi:MAG: hypothetical protein IPH52_27685 [Leptospiraceae bacterium]|nr:hypothetical protein [Leptospiraceae bacterium]